MRTIVLILFIITGTLCQAQENYSTIYIWMGKGYQKMTFELGINNRRITSFSGFELVEFKIYSTGLINIEIIRSPYPQLETSVQLDVESGKKYYLMSHYPRMFKKSEEKLTEEEAKVYFDDEDYFKRKLFFEEDINNPIGQLPKSAITKGPKQGTGFLLSNEGYVITNFHVIDGAKKITIKGINGDYSTSLEATLVISDAVNDLAILKINSKLITFTTPPYSIVPSREVKQGEKVFALGYPIKTLMGNEIKVTDGIINSKSGFKGSISQFQFSAPVQPGNSGGPLFNEKGEVIGLVSAKLNPELAESAGYALKSDYVLFFIDQAQTFEYQAGEKTAENINLAELVELYSNYVFIIETE